MRSKSGEEEEEEEPVLRLLKPPLFSPSLFQCWGGGGGGGEENDIMQKDMSRGAEWSRFQLHSTFQRGVKRAQKNELNFNQNALL